MMAWPDRLDGKKWKYFDAATLKAAWETLPADGVATRDDMAAFCRAIGAASVSDRTADTALQRLRREGLAKYALVKRRWGWTRL